MKKIILGTSPPSPWPRRSPFPLHRPMPPTASSTSRTATSRRAPTVACLPPAPPTSPSRRTRPRARTTTGPTPCGSRAATSSAPTRTPFHGYWADFGADANDPMMIVNGFQNENQKVWSQTITPEPSATPGSKITFDFTANATNILPPENVPDAPGANISVTINGTSIGSQDLTGVNPGNVVQFVGAVPWAPDDGGHRLEQRHGVLRQRLRDRRHLADPARRERATVRRHTRRRVVQLHRQVHRHRSPGADRPEVEALPAQPAASTTSTCAASTSRTSPARQGQGRLVRLEGLRHDLPGR